MWHFTRILIAMYSSRSWPTTQYPLYVLVRSSMNTEDPDKGLSEATTYIEFGSPTGTIPLTGLPLTYVGQKGSPGDDTTNVLKIHLPPCYVLDHLKRNSAYRVVGVTSVGKTCIWTCEYVPFH